MKTLMKSFREFFSRDMQLPEITFFWNNWASRILWLQRHTRSPSGPMSFRTLCLMKLRITSRKKFCSFCRKEFSSWKMHWMRRRQIKYWFTAQLAVQEVELLLLHTWLSSTEWHWRIAWQKARKRDGSSTLISTSKSSSSISSFHATEWTKAREKYKKLYLSWKKTPMFTTRKRIDHILVLSTSCKPWLPKQIPARQMKKQWILPRRKQAPRNPKRKCQTS